MSPSFWAIHSCQYKGMVYCSELQFLFREEIFKIRTGFPHHVPLFLSCWFPFASLKQFSLHCNSQTSVLGQCKWRKDTDYTKGCRGALHSTKYSYSCSAFHFTVHRKCQHFLIFGPSATRCMLFLFNMRTEWISLILLHFNSKKHLIALKHHFWIPQTAHFSYVIFT